MSAQQEIDIAPRVSYLPEIHRLMPNASEAEKALLCSFLLCPREIGQMCVEQGITADHFYFPAHGLIYSVLLEFWHENEPLDVISLTVDMRNKGTLAQVGGAGFLTDLCGYLPTAANAGQYIEIIREKYILREVIKIGTEAASRGYDEQDDVPKLLGDTVDQMMKIVRLAEGQKTHSRTMRELVRLALDSFEKELTNPGLLEMPSGIGALDFYTDGFVPPEVTVIMAKPSDGKTAIALNIAEHLAVNCGKKVGIISLEMSDVQLTKRLIFAMARVDTRQIKRAGSLTDDEHAAIVHAGQRLQVAPIFIRDDGALTTGEISATAAAWKAKNGLDMLIVDHAQLARPDKETESRTSDVEKVSNAMKPIAKRLGIALILLSQVSADAHGNYSTKNSKAIEADADNLWTLSHKREDDGNGKKVIVQSWISLDKQRDRERYVTVPLIFNEAIQRFAEKSKEQIEADQPALIDFGKLSKTRPKKKS